MITPVSTVSPLWFHQWNTELHNVRGTGSQALCMAVLMAVCAFMQKSNWVMWVIALKCGHAGNDHPQASVLPFHLHAHFAVSLD